MNDQTCKSTKTKSWITLGGGAIVALIPFIGLIMWLLFLPVVILVGRWGYRLIGLGDTKGGVIHLAAAAFFVPFAFLAPLATTFFVSDLIWPPTAPNASSTSGSPGNAASGDSGQTPTSGKRTVDNTRQTWSKLMTALNAMKEFNKSNTGFMQGGKDYLAVDGVMDLTIQVFATVGQIKTEGADPELASFMKRLSEDGVDVFQRLKVLTQAGRNAGSNVSQQAASAYVQAVKIQMERLGSMDHSLGQMHAFLIQKYGDGFESPNLGMK